MKCLQLFYLSYNIDCMIRVGKDDIYFNKIYQ